MKKMSAADLDAMENDFETEILGNMNYRVYRYNPTDVFLLIGTNDILRKYNLQTSYDNCISILLFIVIVRNLLSCHHWLFLWYLILLDSPVLQKNLIECIC